jgi:adenylate kinase family enzyme
VAREIGGLDNWMRMARKIVVKGSPGAGKSTFAAELARRRGLAYIELDGLFHGPNWSAPSADVFRARVEAALDAAPRGWVVDGNYDSKLSDLVVAQAEAIIWLDLAFYVKFKRLWRRTLGRIRNDTVLWNGNRETWRGAFLSRDSLFIWMVKVHIRHRREWPALYDADPRLVRLTSPAEVERWLHAQSWVDAPDPIAPASV